MSYYVLPKYGYPQDQLNRCDIEVLLNVVTYFDTEWYVCDQDLTLSYQTLLVIYKVHDWAVLSYYKAQGQEPCPTEVTTATIDVTKSKNPIM